MSLVLSEMVPPPRPLPRRCPRHTASCSLSDAVSPPRKGTKSDVLRFAHQNDVTASLFSVYSASVIGGVNTPLSGKFPHVAPVMLVIFISHTLLLPCTVPCTLPSPPTKHPFIRHPTGHSSLLSLTRRGLSTGWAASGTTEPPVLWTEYGQTVFLIQSARITQVQWQYFHTCGQNRKTILLKVLWDNF